MSYLGAWFGSWLGGGGTSGGGGGGGADGYGWLGAWLGNWMGGAGGETPEPPPAPTGVNPIPLFGWPLFSDRSTEYAPTLTGGSWVLPLTHLQDRRLGKLARSSDATLASTQFAVDLKVARPIGLLALPKQNFSTTARVRWRASNTDGDFSAPLYDSGWKRGWPHGVTREDAAGINVAHVCIPPSIVTARYWLVEIDDEANADGYVDLSRLVIAGAWYPEQGGLSIGAKIGFEDASQRSVTDGGAALYNRRAIRRTWDFALPEMTETEAVAKALKMQRQLGITGQLFFVFDVNDFAMHERAFLCVMRDLSPIEAAWAAYYTAAYRLVEEL